VCPVLRSSKDKAKFVMEVIEMLIIVFALSWFSKTYVIGFAAVKDNAMLPTLSRHSQVFVAKFLRTANTLERGDIIAFRAAKNSYVKRLIGLPGDQIELRNGFVYINGQPLYEPYAQTPVSQKIEALTVPPDTFFVLNDNRSEQDDSRIFGCIPIEDIMGKAVVCYWPWFQIKIL